MRFRVPVRGLAVIGLTGLMAACSPTPELLLRQDLFNLPLGKLEYQVDLFRTDYVRGPLKNRLFMRDGLFHFLNGNSLKVLEFTSFGDILSMYYNPQANPKPVILQADDSGRTRNRVAITYGFQNPGELAVLQNGTLLVEDLAPESRRIYDKASASQLASVILRFSDDHKQLDYLGQDGPGGLPFPPIQSLRLTLADDIVVTCRTNRGFSVFWFDARGKRKYVVEIPDDQVPVPEIGTWNHNLKTILPDPEYPLLQVLLDYYPLNSSSKVESRVYQINLLNGLWERYIVLPEARMDLDATPAGAQSLYQFLGMTFGGQSFFVARQSPDRYRLTILDRSGRVTHQRLLDVPDTKASEIQYHLAFDGILSAFMTFADRGAIAWWRTDKLIAGRTTEDR